MAGTEPGDGVLLVIPARLRSTRLPRKVLLHETGKYLVQHVWERARGIRGADALVIAADDEEVRAACAEFGADVVMTSADHPSGTDRAAEVARARRPRIVVNLQADEPELEAVDVDRLIDAMDDARAEMGTLVHPALTDEEQADPSVVKAVLDGTGWAVDFRREPTPGGFRHIGIYAYRADFLQRFTSLPPSPREKERRLEQMRALDAGVRLRAVLAGHKGVGIDTPADYAAFVARERAR